MLLCIYLALLTKCIHNITANITIASPHHETSNHITSIEREEINLEYEETCSK